MVNNNGYRAKTIYDDKIEKKLANICSKKGELYYTKIVHPVYESYSELDIVTKKLLLKDMNNMIISTKASIEKTIIIVDSNTNLHNLLSGYDHKTKLPSGLGTFSGRTYKYNDILHEYTEWYKIYIKDDKGNLQEIDFDKIGSNTLNGLINLKIYLKNYIIKYAMQMGYKVPLLDINEDIRDILKELYSIFDEKEIEYLKECKEQ